MACLISCDRSDERFLVSRADLAYALMAIILVHIFFVVRVEVTEGGGIASAMFTGNKVTDKTPVNL